MNATVQIAAKAGNAIADEKQETGENMVRSFGELLLALLAMGGLIAVIFVLDILYNYRRIKKSLPFNEKISLKWCYDLAWFLTHRRQ